MITRFIPALATAFLLSGPAFAGGVPVDLSPWIGDGASWSLSAGNNTASQLSNSPTSVLSTGENDLGKRFRGTLGVNSTSDDDFIGFVLGYNPGDISVGTGNTNVDYLLVDWKQSNQGDAERGMAVSTVSDNIYVIGDSGTITTASDAWKHSGAVTEIERANTLGDTGWADNTSYTFQVDYLPDLLHVYINGVLEIDLVPGDIGAIAFNPGSFGFYSFSQTQTEFAAITVENISTTPVPVPAGLPLAVAGLGALAWLRRRRG